MKKLISIGLVLVLAGGLILAENKKAEAIDPASAALIGASIMLLPVIGAMSHDHYRPAPYYSGGYYDNPYPVQTRVYYNAAPRYERYYARNWNRGYGYERDWSRHRERFEDRRARDYDLDRYSGRHSRYNN
jgi:hypothetical protein